MAIPDDDNKQMLYFLKVIMFIPFSVLDYHHKWM